LIGKVVAGSHMPTHTPTQNQLKLIIKLHNRNEQNQNVIVKRSFYKDCLQRNSSKAPPLQKVLHKSELDYL